MKHFLFSLFFLSSTAFAAPELSVGTQTISVAGITQGSSVVLLGVMRDSDGYDSTIRVNSEILADTDNDGLVSFDLGRAVSPKSVWYAVDLTTGVASGAAFGKFPWGQRQAPLGLVNQGASGKLDAITANREMVFALLVRPNVGSWLLTSQDNVMNDSNPPEQNGISTSLASFASIGITLAPPTELATGDVLFLVDPMLMEYFGGTVTVGTAGVTFGQ